MFPTIHRFMEGLLSPRTSLRTLSEARFAQDGTGALLLERTTLFAEAQCTLGDRRLRLFCPLSPLAHRLAETTAQRLKYHPAEFLLPWRMLRGEFTYTDATGTQRTCDLVAQELPAEGEPLATAVGHADRDRLLSALDTLQRQLAQAGLTHNNLKAANLWMTPDYRLLPLRYAYMRFDGGDDAPQFDALRAFVAEKASVAQMMCDTSAEYSAPCTAFRNHLWVGHMFEQMICVEDAEGYGYVDTQNRYLIAPQYRWANDFHEGRAEVQTADGRMGLIDKTGRYVLEPHYEIVEYDDPDGTSAGPPRRTLGRLRLRGPSTHRVRRRRTLTTKITTHNNHGKSQMSDYRQRPGRIYGGHLHLARQPEPRTLRRDRTGRPADHHHRNR